jgi:hypothetical protein
LRASDVVGGGQGEKDYANLLRPPIVQGLCSPSRHHQRRLRPPVYGSPAQRNRNKQHKTTQKHTPHNTNSPASVATPRLVPCASNPPHFYSNNPNFHSPSLPSAASSPSTSSLPLPPSSSPLSPPPPPPPSLPPPPPSSPSPPPSLPYSLPV